MPFATRDGVRLHWRADGDPANPPLLLLNSLGTDLTMWDGVMPSLTEALYVVRMDTRGHGGSDAPEGDYTIPMLAEDAHAVMEAAELAQAHVCGLSMGGMQVLHLLEMEGGRVGRAIVANSSAQVAAEPWLQRAAIVREKGVEAIVDAIMTRFFSEPFRAANPAGLAAARDVFLRNSAAGYAACCAAIAHLDVFDGLATIRTPLMVINGARDEATPPSQHGERIAAAIADSETVVIDAGHLSAVEQPEAFARAVLSFLVPPA